MYGSARARVYYGAGDYSRRMAMAQGYYPGGGFFSSLASIGKSALGAVSSLSKMPVVGGLLKSVPIIGTGLSLASTAADIIGGLGAKRIAAGGVQQGPSVAAVKQLRDAGVVGPGIGVGGLPSMALERGSPRRRRSSKRRPRSTGRSSRRRRRAGDYGDDWSGNRPSRAKGSGQFLTRAGGRRRHPRRRRGRGRGQRVSFVTKSGKRVSFNAKGDGDAVA